MSNTLYKPSELTSEPTPSEQLLSVRIKHSRINEIMEELVSLIYPNSCDNILLVCGPTGVGKTMLSKQLIQDAINKAEGQMSQNAGLVPAVYVEAPASGEKQFSWKLFYARILHALDGDLSLKRTAYGIDPQSGRMFVPQAAWETRNSNLASIRVAVENTLLARQTQFIVIDEAAHLLTKNQRDLEIQVNTLKSLSNQCNTQIVLVGSYDLYPLMSLSDQIARRTHVLHFERYRQDIVEDRIAFYACLKHFQDKLPNVWGTQLMQYADDLHENSLGCVGTLRNILHRSIRLTKPNISWSKEILTRALLTDAQNLKILESTLIGEQAINPSLVRKLPTSCPKKTNKKERRLA